MDSQQLHTTKHQSTDPPNQLNTTNEPNNPPNCASNQSADQTGSQTTDQPTSNKHTRNITATNRQTANTKTPRNQPINQPTMSLTGQSITFPKHTFSQPAEQQGTTNQAHIMPNNQPPTNHTIRQAAKHAINKSRKAPSNPPTNHERTQQSIDQPLQHVTTPPTC